MSTLITEAQRDAIKGKHWQIEMALDGDDGGVIVYRCQDLKLVKIIRTPKTKRHKLDHGEWGKQEVTYKIDGEKTEYDSLAEVLNQLTVLKVIG